MKSQNNLVHNIMYQSLIVTQLLCIKLDRLDGFIRSDDGTRLLVLEIKGMISFTTGLDNL